MLRFYGNAFRLKAEATDAGGEGGGWGEGGKWAVIRD